MCMCNTSKGIQRGEGERRRPGEERGVGWEGRESEKDIGKGGGSTDDKQPQPQVGDETTYL